MAHVFTLTDGTTTITLSNTSTSYIITEYEDGTVEDSKMSLDGEPEITETLDVLVKGTSGPNIQVLIHAVQNLLVAAARRNDTASPLYKTGPRIYLTKQVDQDATAYRAEILEGHFKPDKSLTNWFSNTSPQHLMVTHRVWEGPETELHLSTSVSAYATGGQTIYNHDDAGSGHDNYVQVQPTDLLNGVLSTPVKLTLTNTSGSAVGFRNFYLACNAFSDPANLVHMLEGEAAVGGSSTVDANSSSGNYYHYTFTTTGEIQWALTAAQMQRTQGRTFRILARMFSWSGTNLFVKPILKDATGTITLYGDADEILLGSSGSQIIDLGALPLPNGGYQVAWGDMRLALELRCTGAGVLNIDFMQLTPLDAYQVVNQRGLSISNGDMLTFDSIEGVMYATTGQPIYSPLHGQLRVFPNVTQKLIILSDEGTSSNIARTFTVRAYIRERRLTV